VSGEYFEKGITRVIGLSNNSKNLFNQEITIDQTTDKYSPMLAITYGKGYFVFSTLEITKDNIDIISRLIKEAKKL
jgi:hypothetical protein